jgi:acetylornithine deacetylase/succinyl-diaminopimelate desuccinylase-like protein
LSDAVLERLLAERAQFIVRLAELVACPSVSTDPAYAAGMAAARHWLIERLTTLGFQDAQEIAAGGHPAVTARWHGAGPEAPTLLVYGHYDVQPPDPADAWASKPFQLTSRDGRLYARGVSDDKGPFLLAVETLGAFLAVEGTLPVNVTLLLEGEEECGSATLGALLTKYRDLLAADAVLSADGARWRADLPTMTVGTRGNTGMEITLRSAAKDLHSGRYGGVAPNALHAMARLIATLHDANGDVAVDGFWAGAKAASPEQCAELARIPFDVAQHDASIGIAPSHLAPADFLERLWLRPTLDVNGMWGGYTGAGGKTVIPALAHAKLSMRLIPGQDPMEAREAVARHLRAHCPKCGELTITNTRDGTYAYSLPASHPLLLAAEAALERTTGQKPLRVRMGATLPLADIARNIAGIDTIMFSFATADEDFHAPNENWREASIAEGFAAWVALLRELNGVKRTAFHPTK